MSHSYLQQLLKISVVLLASSQSASLPLGKSTLSRPEFDRRSSPTRAVVLFDSASLSLLCLHLPFLCLRLLISLQEDLWSIQLLLQHHRTSSLLLFPCISREDGFHSLLSVSALHSDSRTRRRSPRMLLPWRFSSQRRWNPRTCGRGSSSFRFLLSRWLEPSGGLILCSYQHIIPRIITDVGRARKGKADVRSALESRVAFNR